MTKQMYFNWGDGWAADLSLEDTQEIPTQTGWDLRLTAYVKVSLHETEASSRKALIRARKKFVEVANCKPKIQKAFVTDREEVILFTTRQIEYTIEIIANEDAITAYYNNLII